MSLFKLKQPMASNYRVDPADIVSTKTALNSLGYYQIPERGIDDWTDDAMFQGIRSFQKDSGLKVDGLMRPEGPTETAINRKLSQGVQLAADTNDGDWEYDGDVDAGDKRDVTTHGPVKVEVHNPGPSWNGLRYKVDWYGLDKDGKVIPEFRRPDHDDNLPEEGGLVLGQRTEKIFKPPFDNSNGYQFRLNYPPQGEYTPFEGSPHIKVYRTKKR